VTGTERTDTDALHGYLEKRDFSRTPEPRDGEAPPDASEAEEDTGQEGGP
jgi:hypothetical protein